MGAKYDNSGAFLKELYDSDKDLTKAEQNKINYSRYPDKEREKAWKSKGSWKKIKKALKRGFYGDKQG